MRNLDEAHLQKDNVLVQQFRTAPHGSLQRDTAFTGVMKTHDRLVYATCRPMLPHDEAARDVTQEVFLQLWQYLHTLDHAGALHSWLRTTARNACLDLLPNQPGPPTSRPDQGAVCDPGQADTRRPHRKYQPPVDLVGDDLRGVFDNPGPGIHTTLDPQERVVIAVLLQETRALIAQVLPQLSGRYQQLYQLIYEHGMDGPVLAWSFAHGVWVRRSWSPAGLGGVDV